MAQFSVNADRFDPYKNLKFRVKWDGRYVAGVSKVGALKRSTEPVTHREGGDPSTVRKSPGQTKYDAITLERGVTHDPEFEQWANKIVQAPRRREGKGPPRKLRKDLVLELYDESGERVKTIHLRHCWISVYQALPELDASSNAVAIEVIKLEHDKLE